MIQFNCIMHEVQRFMLALDWQALSLCNDPVDCIMHEVQRFMLALL